MNSPLIRSAAALLPAATLLLSSVPALTLAATGADAIEIAPGIFSILLHGESHEIRVAPNSDGSLTLRLNLHQGV